MGFEIGASCQEIRGVYGIQIIRPKSGLYDHPYLLVGGRLHRLERHQFPPKAEVGADRALQPLGRVLELHGRGRLALRGHRLHGLHTRERVGDRRRGLSLKNRRQGSVEFDR